MKSIWDVFRDLVDAHQWYTPEERTEAHRAIQGHETGEDRVETPTDVSRETSPDPAATVVAKPEGADDGAQ